MPGGGTGSLTVRRSTALSPVDRQHAPGTRRAPHNSEWTSKRQATKGGDSTAPRVHRRPHPRSPTHRWWCISDPSTITDTQMVHQSATISPKARTEELLATVVAQRGGQNKTHNFGPPVRSPDVATAAHVVAVRTSAARPAIAPASNVRLRPGSRGWLDVFNIYISVPIGTAMSCHIHSLEH